VQVYCRCPIDLALDRYLRRAESSDRHPGHLPEHQSDAATEHWRNEAPEPLDLDGALLEVVTATPVDVANLATRIRLLL
jgi:hypothetical protein